MARLNTPCVPGSVLPAWEIVLLFWAELQGEAREGPGEVKTLVSRLWRDCECSCSHCLLEAQLKAQCLSRSDALPLSPPWQDACPHSENGGEQRSTSCFCDFPWPCMSYHRTQRPCLAPSRYFRFTGKVLAAGPFLSPVMVGGSQRRQLLRSVSFSF